MAISQGTARKRVSNARAILRERWNEYDGVPEDSGSLLAADVEADVTDGLSVGELTSGRLGEVKRNPTRAELSVGEPALLAADVEADVTDGLSVGELPLVGWVK